LHPAEIGDGMVKQVSSILNGLKWSEEDVADFLGQYLTEPKSHLVFDTPKNISLPAFEKRMKSQGIQLSFKSQLLSAANCFYLNGEKVVVDDSSASLLMTLANTRVLLPEYISAQQALTEAFVAETHAWYLAGCIMFLQ
jgi:50S ribosomal protein L16 3-hydroxylase